PVLLAIIRKRDYFAVSSSPIFRGITLIGKTQVYHLDETAGTVCLDSFQTIFKTVPPVAMTGIGDPGDR
ncbi:MAG TPA: hypothetical protein VLN56_10605, partial [Gammaproteobacteria bacterium]|nr:hypothetical protein [Gammaproteobacteria bacterium]